MSKSTCHCGCVTALPQGTSYNPHRTSINLLSDSSGDEDIFESEVKVSEVVETEWKGYAYMPPEILNNNTQLYIYIY